MKHATPAEAVGACISFPVAGGGAVEGENVQALALSLTMVRLRLHKQEAEMATRQSHTQKTGARLKRRRAPVQWHVAVESPFQTREAGAKTSSLALGRFQPSPIAQEPCSRRARTITLVQTGLRNLGRRKSVYSVVRGIDPYSTCCQGDVKCRRRRSSATRIVTSSDPTVATLSSKNLNLLLE